MPPRGWLLAGWALLPVRAFLAVTFTFAGLQKLANPSFFSRTAAGGIYAQMLAAERTSPIRFLLSHLISHSTPLGYLMAFGELAVGLGMALGLWTRLAAAGGALIALSLFLTVSYTSNPYYLGSDIVFFFMFTPFVVAGAGGVLSLDAFIATRAAKVASVPSPTNVVVPFAQVQAACGFYDKGRCTAIPKRHCAPAGCPYLEGVRPTLLGGRPVDAVDRRAVVLGATAAATAATAAAALALADFGIGHALSSKGAGATTPTLPTGTTGATGSSGATGSGGATYVGPAADVPVGSSAQTTVPGSSDPAIVIHQPGGQFVAYDAICPHAGCTVGYQPSANVIACPCHGSQFQVSDGAVIVGPAEVGLTPLSITDTGGKLYLKA